MDFALLDFVSTPAAVLDAQLRVVHVNSSFAATFQVQSVNEVVGEPFESFVLAKRDEMLEAAHNNAITLVVSACKVHCTFRLSFQRLRVAGGEILATLIDKSPFLDRLHAVLDGILSPIVVAHADMIIESVNRATVELFGYAAQELIGQHVRVLMPPDAAAQHDGYVARYLSTNAPHVIGTAGRAVQVRCKNGQLLDLILSVSETRDSAGHRIFTAAFHDASDLVAVARVREADAAMRAKASFLANMSHELRTPMNGVIGLLGVLSDSSVTPDQRRLLDMCTRAARSLLTVLDDILLFSKADAGRLRVVTEPFHLLSVVEDVAHLLYPLALEKKLSMVVDVDMRLSSMFIGDASRLRQVLTNLLGNAIKFTDRGQVNVFVTPLGGGVQFEVEDTGIGIDPVDIHEKLFRPFSQLRDSTVREYQGTGLGLVISKTLVELMGGASINVSSRLGRGSTFSFVLPLVAVPPTAIAPPVQLSQLHGRRVLVVDDNGVNRIMLRNVLQHYGMQVAEVASGVRALELAKAAALSHQPFHAALFDHHMPVMSGIDVARAIRRDPSLRSMQLVLLTSTVEIVSLPPTVRQLVDAIETKPIRREQLIRLLDNLLSGALRLESAVGGDHDHDNDDVADDDDFVKKRSDDTGYAIDAITATSKVSEAVLVVDDVQINAIVTSHMVNALGYTATEFAVNGVEAIERFDSAREYAFVLMDIHMPIMDGVQAIKVIRQLESQRGTRRTPIFVVTADTTSEMHARCVAAGADGVAYKPLSRDQLAAMISDDVTPPRRRSSAFSDQRVAADVAAIASRAVPIGYNELPLALFVDDDATMRAVLEHLFRKLSWKCQSFASCEALLTRLQDANSPVPLLVLCDVHVPPGMSGVELCKRIRTDGLVVPKLALMTASVATDVARIESGVEDVLIKPVDLSTLRRLCQSAKGVAIPTASDNPLVAALGDPPEPPPFDPASAVAFTFDAATLHRVTREFCLQIDVMVVHVAQAFVERNTRRVRELSHAIRGAALNFAAAPLTRAMSQVSSAAQAGEYESDSAIQTALAEWARLRKALLLHITEPTADNH